MFCIFPAIPMKSQSGTSEKQKVSVKIDISPFVVTCREYAVSDANHTKKTRLI